MEIRSQNHGSKSSEIDDAGFDRVCIDSLMPFDSSTRQWRCRDVSTPRSDDEVLHIFFIQQHGVSHVQSGEEAVCKDMHTSGNRLRFYMIHTELIGDRC